MPTAEAEAFIDAPIGLVWQVMLDLSAYAAWNPFVVRIDCAAPPPAVGGALVLHVRWRSGQGTTVRERITRLEPPDEAGHATLEYAFEGPLSRLNLVRARRAQALERVSPTQTRYLTRERLTGLLAWAAPMTDVRDGFARHAAALKARAEALAIGPAG